MPPFSMETFSLSFATDSTPWSSPRNATIPWYPPPLAYVPHAFVLVAT